MCRVGSEGLRAAANVSTRSQRNSCQRGVENTCPAVILKNISFQNVTSGSLAFLAWHPSPNTKISGMPLTHIAADHLYLIEPSHTPVPPTLVPACPPHQNHRLAPTQCPTPQNSIGAHTPHRGCAHPPHRGCAHPKTLRNDN